MAGCRARLAEDTHSRATTRPSGLRGRPATCERREVPTGRRVPTRPVLPTCLVSVECDDFLEEVTLGQGPAHRRVWDRGGGKGHSGQLGQGALC